MTEHVRIEHTFECSEKAFWDTFLDEAYNKEMFLGRMRFRRWDLANFELNEKEMKRLVECEPYVGNLPGAIKKVIGDSVRYQEEGHLDRANHMYTMKIVPGKLADKIRMTGEQFTEAKSPDQVKRVFTAEVQVKIFGIGAMIEKHIVADLKKSYDIGADFTREYMSQRGIK